MPPPPQHPDEASLPNPDDVAILSEPSDERDKTPHDPYVALRNKNYFRYFIGSAFSLVGSNMTAAVVAYELYQLTHSNFWLGMIGLVQVIPVFFLALPAGFFIDRLDRKQMILTTTAVQIGLWILMGFSSRYADSLFPSLGAPFGLHNAHVIIMLFLLLLNGIGRAINQPAKSTLLPMLVPQQQLPNAVTWNATLFETTNVTGPLIFAGALYVLMNSLTNHQWNFAILYWINALCGLVYWINMARIDVPHISRIHAPATAKHMITSIVDGASFVYKQKLILSAITLDMFAVLLGGATALLPAFADKVLHVGALGYGGLRAAPSIGAVAMALITAHLPPMKNAGRNLLISVAGFGAAIIVFGTSRNYWLSIAALLATGVFDNVSVVVRHSLVQLLTPDHMRGRVNAVNHVFISSSNELGEFESGTTAAMSQWACNRFLGYSLTEAAKLGPQLAVVAGGAGTIVVVIAAALLWPELAKVRRLDQIKAASTPPPPPPVAGFPVQVDPPAQTSADRPT